MFFAERSVLETNMTKVMTMIFGVVCVVFLLGSKANVSERFPGNLPRLSNASLLLGWPPSFLYVTNPHEDVRLQPEKEQPDTRDSSSLFPSITSDGTTIAYARLKAAVPERIVTISTYSVRTTKHTEYATGEFSGSTAISPDGSKLAYPGAQPRSQTGGKTVKNHLHIVDLRTGDQTIGPEISYSRWPVFASWSPNSRELVFANLGEISVWDIDTKEVRKLANGDLPAWSPSGEWIAYFPEHDAFLGNPTFSRGRWGSKCVIVRPDGTSEKTLVDWTQSENYRTFVEPPVWSPDSRTLLLNEMDDGIKDTVTVHAIDIATLEMKTLFRRSNHILGWARAN
jgi:Tol biopolymer transport system component